MTKPARANDFYLAAGNAAAVASAHEQIRHAKNVQLFRRNMLSPFVRSVFEQSIKAASEHPHHSGVQSCRGPVNVVTLPGLKGHLSTAARIKR